MKNKDSLYCVYSHINKINGKIYIGITSDIQKRWKPSAYKLCKYFYKAIQKYGWDNFDHIVLVDNIQYEIACECEKYLIKKYNSINSEHGYNLARGGTGGATTSGERHRLSKKVYQYDLDGNFIKEWCNAPAASKETGVNVSDIQANARGKVSKAGNYQWSYEYSPKIHKYKRNKPMKNKNIIYQFSSNWEITNIYNTVYDIPVDQRKRDKIIECCNFKRLTSQGYFWFYEKDLTEENINHVKNKYDSIYVNRTNMKIRKPVLQFSTNKKYIKLYNSVYEASEETNIKPGTIQHACKQSLTHYAKGYCWYYPEDVNFDYSTCEPESETWEVIDE